MQPSNRCEIFVTENRPSVGQYEVQFQFPAFTATLPANNLAFAKQILEFVEKTKENPEFRDIPLGGGVYRHMPEASIDVSPCFSGTTFVFQKLGEYDTSYTVRITSPSGLRLHFDIHDEQLIAFVQSLRDLTNDSEGEEAGLGR